MYRKIIIVHIETIYACIMYEDLYSTIGEHKTRKTVASSIEMNAFKLKSFLNKLVVFMQIYCVVFFREENCETMNCFCVFCSIKNILHTTSDTDFIDTNLTIFYRNSLTNYLHPCE